MEITIEELNFLTVLLNSTANKIKLEAIAKASEKYPTDKDIEKCYAEWNKELAENEYYQKLRTIHKKMREAKIILRVE